MATGNLFLGTARRKLGDVVFYRRNGVQQSRVRVRTISNPKSEGQALQRAYFAPVSKFYSPLASVLETSWEGLNRLKSYNAFQSAALRDARSHGWYVPKAEGFVPLPYQISKGTLPVIQCFFDRNAELFVRIDHTVTDTVASVSQYFIAAGAQQGDQVTFICCLYIGEGQVVPSWCRFFVDTSDTRVFSQVARTPFFYMKPAGGTGGTGDMRLQFADIDYAPVAGAVILSRWDSTRQMWLRSSSWMVCESEFMMGFVGDEARGRAIISYQDATRVTTSEVYLNGSGMTDFSAELFSSSSSTSLGRFITIDSIEVVTIPDSSGANAEFLTVIGHDISDGELVRAAVFNADDGYFLKNYAEWDHGVNSPLIPYIAVRDDTDDAWVWLRQHGVTVEFSPSGNSVGTHSVDPRAKKTKESTGDK